MRSESPDRVLSSEAWEMMDKGDERNVTFGPICTVEMYQEMFVSRQHYCWRLDKNDNIQKG